MPGRLFRLSVHRKNEEHTKVVNLNTQQPQHARVPEEHASSESNKLIRQGDQQRGIAEALMVITWQLTYRKRTSSWDNSI